MKNKPKFFGNVCFWLSIISVLLFIGIVLFGTYLYKASIITLIDFRTIFYGDEGTFDSALFWSAISAIAAIIAVIVAYKIGKKTNETSDKVANMQKEQSRLYSEPHTIITTISILNVNWEHSSDEKKIKTIKECNYPYYTELTIGAEITNLSMIKIDFLNTSEAFTRLRFCEAEFTDQDKIVMSFNMSTVGTHANHIVVSNKETTNAQSIGLLLPKDSLSKLRGTVLTIRCFLDNNFGNCYKETQNYVISDVIDETVSFYPVNTEKNKFEKIH